MIMECTWATSIRLMLNKYDFNAVWRNQNVGSEQLFVPTFIQRITESMNPEWYNTIHDQSRMNIYCTYKHTLEPEFYVFCLDDKRLRQYMARFRCGMFKLAIEVGRRDNTLIQDRICIYC